MNLLDGKWDYVFAHDAIQVKEIFMRYHIDIDTLEAIINRGETFSFQRPGDNGYGYHYEEKKLSVFEVVETRQYKDQIVFFGAWHDSFPIDKHTGIFLLDAEVWSAFLETPIGFALQCEPVQENNESYELSENETNTEIIKLREENAGLKEQIAKLREQLSAGTQADNQNTTVDRSRWNASTRGLARAYRTIFENSKDYESKKLTKTALESLIEECAGLKKILLDDVRKIAWENLPEKFKAPKGRPRKDD